MKVVKPKKIVKKIKHDKSRYQGKAIKKKFAPKKIGPITPAPKIEENNDEFKVVAQIESDDDKPTGSEPVSNLMEEPIINVISNIDEGEGEEPNCLPNEQEENKEDIQQTY